jgi:hypothetical protein
VADLGFGGAVSYSPATERATAEVEDWGAAATLNRVLWRIFPEANLAEGENIVGGSIVMPMREPPQVCCTCYALPHHRLRLANLRSLIILKNFAEQRGHRFGVCLFRLREWLHVSMISTPDTAR